MRPLCYAAEIRVDTGFRPHDVDAWAISLYAAMFLLYFKSLHEA